MALTKKSARKYWAEGSGTFWLVLVGVGAALLNTAGPGPALNLIVAIAFGVALLTAMYAYGRISGGHYNPAVTVGLAVAGRFPAAEIVPYVIAQLVGGIIAALVLYFIAGGKAGFAVAGFASNGYAAHSPGGYSLITCAAAELVLTGFFVCIITGATSRKAHESMAPLVIGLTLMVIHLVLLPVTLTSVNPARSTATAVIAGALGGTNWPLTELWLFWVAPIVGAAIGGWAHKELFADD
jgi:aquaporin Z